MFNTIFGSFCRTIGRILAYLLIGGIIAILFMKTTSLQVSADTLKPQGGWVLDDNQYVWSIYKSGDEYLDYKQTSNSWGATVSYSTWYRYIYLFGAYVNNPLCEEDYCLLPNTSYVLNFNFSSVAQAFNAKSIIENNLKGHIKLSYLSSSGATKWIDISSSNVSLTFGRRIDDYTLNYFIVFTTPNLPSDINSISWTGLDFWIDYGADTSTAIIRTNGVASGQAFGITRFSIQHADSDSMEDIQNSQDMEDIKESTENIESSITSTSDDIDSDDCGIICKLGATVKGIANLPGLIWNALKGGFDAISNGISNLFDKITSLFDFIGNDEIDDSKATGFFDNFTTEDNGGISSIVTAPLTFVQKITDTCQPLSIPLYDNDIALPCGDELFWNREDVQGFRNVWNILLGGTIIYALLTKLFAIIQNIKDPDDSKVEVMKL